MDSRQTVDRIINAAYIIPVEPENTVLKDSSIVINGGKIAGIFPTGEVKEKFTAKEIESYPGHALIPGLINLHAHAAMNLMRGMADDMALMPWLTEKIWPTEQKMVSAPYVYDGTLISCREMLAGGITCFNDMYFLPEAAARAVIDSGMRAVIGVTVIDMPTVSTKNGAECLRQGEELIHAIKHPHICFSVAPHALYTVSDETFALIKDFKSKYGLKMHLHFNETDEEIPQSVAKTGLTPIERLKQLNLLDSDLIAVHSVAMSKDDIAELKKANASVAHCPISNLKLGCGVAPVGEMLAQGVTVGIGTDGAASNNRIDLFQEMRFAALLAKGCCKDPTVAPAHTVLKMATLNGAIALGLDKEIGSLAAGKNADICAVDLSRPEYQPCYDPVSHLVYVCGREAVSQVWVDGVPCLDVGKLQQDIDKGLDKPVAVWQNLVLR